MKKEKKKRVIGRSVVQLDDPSRRITVTIDFDDKGVKGENAGGMVRLVNDTSDALRKIANSHEIRVLTFNKVVKK